jgi:hypothetical protein
MSARHFHCAICSSAFSLTNTYTRYAAILTASARPPRLLNVDVRAVAVHGELGRATGEGLSSLLEDYKLISTCPE